MPNDLSALLRAIAEDWPGGTTMQGKLLAAAEAADQQAAEIERLKAPCERIVSAAVRIGPTAVTFPPPARHGDILKAIYDINRKLTIKPSDQGFLTSAGRYVTRGEARLIAVSAGQMADEQNTTDDGWQWAIVEIFGHRRHAGRIREEERFGSKMLRVDVPKGEEWVTHYYGGAAIFGMTPTDEATARKMNAPFERPGLYLPPADEDDEETDERDYSHG